MFKCFICIQRVFKGICQMFNLHLIIYFFFFLKSHSPFIVCAWFSFFFVQYYHRKLKKQYIYIKVCIVSLYERRTLLMEMYTKQIVLSEK